MTPVDARQGGGHARGRVRIVADVEQGADRGRVEARARDARRERGADHERREVADGVAPALVLLLGGDDVVGELGAGGSIAHGDEGGRRSRLAGRAQGLVRDPRAALVRDRDDHPVARRRVAPPRAPGPRVRRGPGGRSSASFTNAASPIAACSEVPQPVVTIGRALGGRRGEDDPRAAPAPRRRRADEPAARRAPARRRSSPS